MDPRRARALRCPRFSSALWRRSQERTRRLCVITSEWAWYAPGDRRATFACTRGGMSSAVRRIRRLTQDLGVNLAGVEVILNLTGKLEQVQERFDRRLEEMETRHRDEINRLKTMLRRVTG